MEILFYFPVGSGPRYGGGPRCARQSKGGGGHRSRPLTQYTFLYTCNLCPAAYLYFYYPKCLYRVASKATGGEGC